MGFDFPHFTLEIKN